VCSPRTQPCPQRIRRPATLADRDAIVRYVGKAAATLGGIDVLVNNASVFGITDA
jgi:3-oxoacyl-[acyl-carrier protein] reductase